MASINNPAKPGMNGGHQNGNESPTHPPNPAPYSATARSYAHGWAEQVTDLPDDLKGNLPPPDSTVHQDKWMDSILNRGMDCLTPAGWSGAMSAGHERSCSLSPRRLWLMAMAAAELAGLAAEGFEEAGEISLQIMSVLAAERKIVVSPVPDPAPAPSLRCSG